MNHIFAGVFGLLAVGLGAFGAHALQRHVPVERLVTWETGVRYMAWHAIALLALPEQYRLTAGLWVGGVLVFSGSLFALVLLDLRKLGMITPIGGVLMLAGWATLVWQAYRQ